LEETGLRIGELCRLRLGDIDLMRKRVFIGLPNKGKKERWAFFSSKTVENFAPWKAERDPECGHDYLLYNLERNPIKPASLRNEFKKVLLKKSSGTSLDQDGFDRWSSHRFRHTMASNLASAGADINVVMAQGGWSTPQMLSTYARVDPELARKGYDQAMRKSNEMKQVKSTKRTLNLDEYLIRVATQPK
jgi:integrase